MDTFKVQCFFNTTTNFYLSIKAESSKEAIDIARQMIISTDPEIHHIIDTAVENNICSVDSGPITVIPDEALVEYVNDENDMC